METLKRSKSEQARINGSKSKGPKTEAGRRRIAKANHKHGLYAVNATVLDVESKEAFNVLRAAAFNQLQPRNPFEAQYVEEIADCSWRIARLRLCATHDSNVSIIRLRQAAERPVCYMDAITKAELDGSTPQGAQSLLQRRVNALIVNRTMITAELRAMRGVPVVGITQVTLIAEDLPVGITQGMTQNNPPETQNNPR
ncbi:MAG: hypothetical protein ACKV2U_20310 [Bryobacteraceae bacterium]